MRRHLRLPSPAMLVALTALTFALGGTAYATVVISGKDVRNGSLTGADVRSNSLTGSDVRGLTARDFRQGQLPQESRWVLVDAAGQIEAQSGGFRVVSGYGANPPGAAGNVYIDAGENLTDNGIVATVALQNAADHNGDGVMNGRAPGADANPEFAGEISASRCAIQNAVTCAPPGANVPSAFVVSPRNSDGSVPPDNARKRFYAVITG